METERMSRKRALEIQDHPVSVSSYNPRKEVEGEYGYVITREAIDGDKAVNRIIFHSPAEYNTRGQAMDAGDVHVKEIRERSFEHGEI